MHQDRNRSHTRELLCQSNFYVYFSLHAGVPATRNERRSDAGERERQRERLREIQRERQRERVRQREIEGEGENVCFG